MRWARANGCTTYDLFGIPDEVGQDPDRYARLAVDRTDGLWGVYRFKRGFGGRTVRYVGAYDDACIRPLYWAYSRVIRLPERVWGETRHRRLRRG